MSLSSAPTAVAAVGDIGSYVSSARTFATVSYWIEGPDSVLVVDTQFLPKDGLAMVAAAQKATGKKVTTAVVLHPNPDKFNGTAALQARGIRVITSRQVRELIPAVHQIRLGWFFDEYKPDYPSEAAQPSIFGERSTETNIAGLPLTLHVLGPGASAAHVVLQFRDHVFVGDLINPDNHAWLELGLIDDWLARLQELRKLAPQRVYPGRGTAGDSKLIDNQARYLEQVQAWVREEKPSGSLGFFAKRRLQNKIENAYPTLGYPIFMRDGLAAVWAAEAAPQKTKAN